MYGDNFSIVCQFKSSTGLTSPSIGIVISSSRGEAIINANNQYLPSPEFSRPVQNGMIRTNMGELPLMEGRYHVSIWFGDHKKSTHDFYENILNFNVIARDKWGQGKIPTKNISSLWCSSVFELEEVI